MKRCLLLIAGLALLAGKPIMAETMKHDDAMCTKHCNIMELQKKVDALKKAENTQDKLATKEHLKKDIEMYEKKLQELKAELDAK